MLLEIFLHSLDNVEREGTSSTEEQVEKLKAGIKSLEQENNPKECEGLVRVLMERISEITDRNMKELHSELRAVSCCGLSGDLKKLVEENGLKMEALDLVVKYLTTVEELAQYFYNHPKSDGELVAVRRRLSPKLEVLGGLLAKGIDVRKDWVTKLIKKAPSFQSLSKMSAEDLEVGY